MAELDAAEAEFEAEMDADNEKDLSKATLDDPMYVTDESQDSDGRPEHLRTPASSTASSPIAAAASSSAGVGGRPPRRRHAGGRPARKVVTGAEAQDIARASQRRGQEVPAAELLEARMEEEGAEISSPYAAKQAKALANALFATAGGVANAVKVMGKLVNLPEVRALLDLIEDPEVELTERGVRNVATFFANHLRTKGTRHAEDQNVHDAILTAFVDEKMLEDKLINAVANLLGARWHAVKDAVERRMKIDCELSEHTHGVWTRVAREERCDKYKLPGFYEYCHDENIFRFSSRHPEPLRNHVALNKYEVRPHTPPMPRVSRSPMRPCTVHVCACTDKHCHALIP
jgi:hypothetical protein